MPCTKVRYSTRQFAEDDVKRIAAKSTRPTVPTRVYWCTECKAYHLTSHGQAQDDELKAELRKTKDELSKFKQLAGEKAFAELRKDEVIGIIIRENDSLKAKVKELNAEIQRLILEKYKP